RSMATSLPVALKLGPVHFVGQPSRKFQRTFSAPNRAALALDLSINGLLCPLPQSGIVRDAPPERDDLVVRQTGQLAHGRTVGPFAVLDWVGADIETRALAESGARDAID